MFSSALLRLAQNDGTVRFFGRSGFMPHTLETRIEENRQTASVSQDLIAREAIRTTIKSWEHA